MKYCGQSLHPRYTGELPYPQIQLTTSSHVEIDVSTRALNAPNKCAVVLVAGPAVHDLYGINNMVYSMMQTIPYMTVLLVDDPEITLNTTRHQMTPPIVRVNVEPSGVFTDDKLIFSYYCVGQQEPVAIVWSLGQFSKGLVEVCPQTVVRMAFNQFPGVFVVDMEKGEMIKQHKEGELHAETADMLGSFFINQNASVTWKDELGNYGWFDGSVWSGTMGSVGVSAL